MRFKVPTSWNELSQSELRYVMKLLWLYGEHPNGVDRVQVASFLHFTGTEVVRRTSDGWLCREVRTSKTFLLDPSLLPSLLEPLGWVCRPETLDVRIDRVGDYSAVDFSLRELMFGDYLQVENFFQSYLQSKQSDCLFRMARLLYRVPTDDSALCLCNEVLLGVFLWFNAAKQLLGREFPHFLKPASDDSGPVTRERLVSGMRAQIRALTKGDVTKQRYILEETDTWTALSELDALAAESERLRELRVDN